MSGEDECCMGIFIIGLIIAFLYGVYWVATNHPVIFFLALIVVIFIIALLFEPSRKIIFEIWSWISKKISEWMEIKRNMKEYKLIMEDWKKEGYEITELEELFRSNSLVKKDKAFKEYQSRIEKLKKIAKELPSLEIDDFKSEISAIKNLLKEPKKIGIIEARLLSLKKKIKKEIVNNIEKTKNILENAIRKATKADDNLWLTALQILKFDFIDFSQTFNSSDVSYKEALGAILDYKDQAEVLSTSPEKKLTYYDILGVKQDATEKQIKDIYRKLSKIYHPDKGKDLGVEGDQRFRDIKEAYDTLINSDKRKEYDKTLEA